MSWLQTQNSPSYETAELIVGGVIPIVLIVVGTFGNLISIVILLNKENRKTSTNIYLIFLCLMDTISLYQWNLSRTVNKFSNGQQDIWGQSLIMCRLSEFFPFFTLHTSAMFLTFVELDRACLLRNVWYKRKIARPRIALIICIIILVIIFGLNGFLFGLGFEYTFYNSNTGVYETNVACYYSLNTELNEFFSVKFAWVHLVVMYIVPFSVMIICTLFTVKKLIFKQVVENRQLARNAQRNRRISIMLLLMCLTYIVTTLPNRLCFSLFINEILGNEYTDTLLFASNTLMYTRSAVNGFFLYISVYGFHRDVRNFILRCFGRRITVVHPTNHTLTRDGVNTRTTVRGGCAIASIELPVIKN